MFRSTSRLNFLSWTQIEIYTSFCVGMFSWAVYLALSAQHFLMTHKTNRMKESERWKKSAAFQLNRYIAISSSGPRFMKFISAWQFKQPIYYTNVRSRWNITLSKSNHYEMPGGNWSKRQMNHTLRISHSTQRKMEREKRSSFVTIEIWYFSPEFTVSNAIRLTFSMTDDICSIEPT